MNKIVCFAVAALAFAAPINSFAEEGVKKMTIEEMRRKAEEFKKLPPEEQARIKAERQARQAARTGGRIRDTSNQTGAILVLNTQNAISTAATEEAMEKLAKFLKIDIRVETAEKADPKDTETLLKDRKANAVIYVGECDKSGALMLAPDERWAFVNTKMLGNENLEDRTKKQVVRAFTFLCGGVASGYPDPMTRPLPDVRRLDLIEQASLPIDVLNRFPEYLKALGVTPYRETTYRHACEEGWAPAPTNDIQKAVWDKAHSEKERGPVNGMKIAPPNKK